MADVIDLGRREEAKCRAELDAELRSHLRTAGYDGPAVEQAIATGRACFDRISQLVGGGLYLPVKFANRARDAVNSFNALMAVALLEVALREAELYYLRVEKHQLSAVRKMQVHGPTEAGFSGEKENERSRAQGPGPAKTAGADSPGAETFHGGM